MHQSLLIVINNEAMVMFFCFNRIVFSFPVFRASRIMNSELRRSAWGVHNAAPVEERMESFVLNIMVGWQGQLEGQIGQRCC